MTSIISDESQWESSPQNLILNQKSLIGVSSLIELPLPTVGSRTIKLENYPVGSDYANRAGCKQQRYTSWDCCSRSYVACITVGEITQDTTRRRRSAEEVVPEFPPPPDTPTQAELDSMEAADRRMLKAGKRVFYRAIGVPITSSQVHQVKYRSLLLRSGVPEDTPLPEDEEEGAVGGSASDEGANAAVALGITEGTQTASLPVIMARGLSPRRHPGTRIERSPKEQQQPQKPKGVQAKPESVAAPKPEPLTSTNVEDVGRTPKSYNQNEVLALLNKWSEDPNIQAFGPHTIRYLAGSIKQVVKDGKVKTAYIPPKSDPTLPQPVLGHSNAGAVKDWKQVYCDTLPVFVVNVGSWRRSDNETTPFSAFFNSVVARLSNPQAEGALGSVIRAPGVRSGSAAFTLAQGLRRNTNTIREEAPLVRLGCIITSLDRSCYRTEIIYQRCVRGWEAKKYLGCVISESVRVSDGKVVAVPVDLFCAIAVGKLPGVTTSYIDEGKVFNIADLDSTWTCVPVDSRDLTSPYLVAYIQSFLTSEYWSGRVNHVYEGVAKPPSGTGSTKSVTYSIMPASNSVHIPGPKHVCLVLLDNMDSDKPISFKIRGKEVPVYRGEEIPVARLGSWSEIWGSYFNTENALDIGADCTLAFNEIGKNLAVGNTVATSLAIVAHLYCRLYQGVGINTNHKKDYDVDEPVIGGWSWFEDGKLSPSAPYKCDYFDVTMSDLSPCRRRLIGYNFSAISPFARAADSVILTERVSTAAGVNCCFWAGSRPFSEWGSTKINTCDSIVRVSIRYGLVVTTEYNLPFETPSGLAGWVHMHSLALACQVGTMFSQNNIDLGLWLGFYMEMEDLKGPVLMMELIKTMSQDYLSWFDLKRLYRSWEQWDYEVISNYYGVDPFDADEWFWSHFPLPAHLLLQWQKKVNAQDYTFPKSLSYLFYGGENLLAVGLPVDGKDARMLTSHTIDFLRYNPIVLATDLGGQKKPLFAWVDQYSWVTCRATVTGYLPDYSEYLESSVLVLPMVANTSALMSPREMYVLGSSNTLNVGAMRETSTSPLEFPDPISLQDIINAAKNYILHPLMSAAAGYLTGGMPGAVIAGGSRIAGQVISDLSAKPSEAKEVMKAVAEKAPVMAEQINKERERLQKEEASKQAHSLLSSPTVGHMSNEPLPPPVVPSAPPAATVGTALDLA